MLLLPCFLVVQFAMEFARGIYSNDPWVVLGFIVLVVGIGLIFMLLLTLLLTLLMIHLPCNLIMFSIFDSFMNLGMVFLAKEGRPPLLSWGVLITPLLNCCLIWDAVKLIQPTEPTGAVMLFEAAGRAVHPMQIL
ncbi:unnamed protein product [Symbiodinium pilosum]|uniref:Uncharacterized protein n=1 Tax=Symbiodinium pilosum TaxID=2952 RepID=A0A812U500_SYMPI|nr:unnamed protein product [Symbiodinium pilosum]